MDRGEPRHVSGRPERATDDAPWTSRAALALLVALVVVSPWPFGSVHAVAVRAISVASLGVAAIALVAQLRDGARLGAAPVASLALLGSCSCSSFRCRQRCTDRSPRLRAGLAPARAGRGGRARRGRKADLDRPSCDPAALIFWLAWSGSRSWRSVRSRATCAVVAATIVVVGGSAVAAFGVVARGLFGRCVRTIPVPTVSPFGPFVSKNHFSGYAR